MKSEPRWLRRSAAAEYLKSKYGFGAKATLAKLAVVGGGPVYRVIGRLPVYDEADLDQWANARMSGPVSSTAEYRAA